MATNMQVFSRYVKQPQPHQESHSKRQEGIALIALLVAINVLSIWIIAVVPQWVNQVQRQQERELIYRGTAIAKAIVAYREDFPAEVLTDLEPLVEHRYLRPSCLRDPFTPDGEWRLLLSSADLNTLVSAIQLGQIEQLIFDQADHISGSALVGVASQSTAKAILKYNPMESLTAANPAGGGNPFAKAAQQDAFALVDRDDDRDEPDGFGDEDGEKGKPLDPNYVRNWYFLAGLADIEGGQTGALQQPGEEARQTLQGIFNRKTGRQNRPGAGQNPFAGSRPKKNKNLFDNQP